MNPTPKAGPILFSAPMVRAIQDGRKTQTRRVIKPQPIEKIITAPDHSGVKLFRPNIDGPMDGVHESFIRNGQFWHCPHGKSGDRLWVSETWSKAKHLYSSELFYRADGECNGKQNALSFIERESKWRPSIHMPRSASRILLEITNVRVERLNEISEQDAIAEGINQFFVETKHTG